MANEFKVKKGLIVDGSGSVVLDVRGSHGQLFSVTDSLSGSLFGISDISGIPIFEVFSDDTIKMGSHGAEAIIISGSTATISNGILSGSFSGSFVGDASGLTGLSSGAVTALNNATANELVTVGSTTTELDAESNLTFNGTLLDVTGNITSSGTGSFGKVNIGGATQGTYLLNVGGYTRAGGVDFLNGVVYANSARITSMEDKVNNTYSSISFAGAARSITFMTSGSNRMVINSDGDVSIPGGALSISGDGSNAVTFTESGAGLLTIAAPDDIKLDANSDIILDANGADIRLSDNGTEVGVINMASSNLTISSKVSDKDIIFQGNDNGTTIDALTLDMSDAGSATFNHNIGLPSGGEIDFNAGDVKFVHSSNKLTLNGGNLLVNAQLAVNSTTVNAVNKLEVHGQARINGKMMIGDSTISNVPNAAVQLHVKNAGQAGIRLEDSDSTNLAFDVIVDEGVGFIVKETVGGDAGDDIRLTIAETTGDATFSGKISGGEIEGTSLDINGNADIAGNLTLSSGGNIFGSTGDFIIQNNAGAQLDIKSNQGVRLYIDKNNDDTTHKFEILSNTGSYNSSNVVASVDQSGNATFDGTLTLGTALAVAEGGTGLTANTTYINSNAFSNFASSAADWDTITTRGLYRLSGGTNNPFGTSHATGFTLTENSGNYGFQLFSKGSTNNAEGLAYRYRGTTWGAWQTIVTKTFGDGRYANVASGSLAGSAVQENTSPTFDDLTVTGNLTITGTVDTYNVNNLNVVDKLIIIGAGQTEANSDGSGIFVSGSSASLLWDETNDTWDFNKSLDITGNLTTSGNITGGGLTLNGSLSRGSYTASSNYHTGSDNIVLKGNSVGISGIFFESEKDGTNINHSTDFGFIQYHAYGTGTSGENAELIIGVSNDSSDHVILNAPSAEGFRVRVAAGETDYKIFHEGHEPTYSEISGTIPTWNQDTTGTAASASHALIADTVTTNANLTGHITSSGNATVLGSFTTAQLNAAISDGTVLTAEADTLDTVADRGATTNNTIKSTNGLGFKVDSAGSARIEIENGGSNWAYLRLRDDSTVSWDIASYNGGNLEWRPGGSATNRMTYSSTGLLSVPSITTTGTIHLDNDSAQLQLGDDNDMQIYHNGANGEINNTTGNFTIDSAGDIILDAAGDSIQLTDNGTLIGKVNMTSQNLTFISSVSNKDMIFRGNDGGTFFTALSLDMSDAGTAAFANDIVVNGDQIRFINDAASAYVSAADALILQSDYNTGENKPIYLQPSAVTELTVATGKSTFVGNVGIGTDTPASKLHVSGTTDLVTIEGSGSVLFDVQGSQGQLFSITDTLEGTLFSVSDVAGIPILEVESSDKVTMGSFGANTLVVTGSYALFGTNSPNTAFASTVQIHERQLLLDHTDHTQPILTVGGGGAAGITGSLTFYTSNTTGQHQMIIESGHSSAEIRFINNRVILDGKLNIGSVAGVATDTDKFLVLDGQVVKYVSGSQLLSQIGGIGPTGATLDTVTDNGATTTNDLATGALNVSGAISLQTDASAIVYAQGDTVKLLAGGPAGSGLHVDDAAGTVKTEGDFAVGTTGTIGTNFHVEGNANITSTLLVTGSATFKNNLNIAGVLDVDQNSEFQNDLVVFGDLDATRLFADTQITIGVDNGVDGKLHIKQNDSTVNSGIIVNQQGPGDSRIAFQKGTGTIAMGIDGTDGKFKIAGSNLSSGTPTMTLTGGDVIINGDTPHISTGETSSLSVNGRISGRIRREPDATSNHSAVAGQQNYWTKLAKFSITSGANEIRATYTLLMEEISQAGYMRFAVELRSNSSGTTPQVADIRVLEMASGADSFDGRSATSAGSAYQADSLKLVVNSNTDIQLWVQKKQQYGVAALFEDTLVYDNFFNSSDNAIVTYYNNSSWQSSEPTSGAAGSNVRTRMPSMVTQHQYAFFTNTTSLRYIPNYTSFTGTSLNYTSRFLIPKGATLVGVGITAQDSIFGSCKLRLYDADSITSPVLIDSQTFTITGNRQTWIQINKQINMNGTAGNQNSIAFGIEAGTSSNAYWNMVAVWNI